MRISFLFLCLYLFLLPLTGFGQRNNVLLTGTVQGDVVGEVIIEINKRYLNNTVETYSARINAANNFGLACRLELPQLVTLFYGNRRYEIFLEPNDSLHLSFNGATFPEYIAFGSRGKANNDLWRQYCQQFPKDPTVFNYRQYRKGSYYYRVHQTMDQLMRSQQPQAFKNTLTQKRLAKQSLLNTANLAPDNSLTEAFKIFLQTEIDYSYALNLLSYCDVYQGRYQMDSTHFRFLDTILVEQDFSLGNANYRNFIKAFVYYQCRQQGNKTSSYKQLYEYSQQHLDGRTKYLTMAHILAEALKKESPEQIQPIYEHFIEENPYYEFDRLVLDPFQKANQFAAGTPAPDFKLYNMSGELVELSSLKNKIVYLDFWASWCRPCMEKLKKLEQFKTKFNPDEVVFLHLSLDRTEDLWKKTVTEQGFTGQHLYVGTNNTALTAAYEVVSVPKFFIITKEGNFAYAPNSFDSNDLELTLKKLLQN